MYLKNRPAHTGLFFVKHLLDKIVGMPVCKKQPDPKGSITIRAAAHQLAVLAPAEI
jgi:hypothetical protein